MAVTRIAHRATSATLVALLVASATLLAAQAPKTGTAAEPKTPQQHLDEAKRVLDSISTASVTGEAARKLFDLKRDFNELATAYGARDNRPVSPAGTSGTHTRAAAGAAPADWRAKYTTVENDLRELVGTGSNMPAGSTTAIQTPTSGGIPNLDAMVRGQLQDVRSHLQMFYAGTLDQREKPKPVR